MKGIAVLSDKGGVGKSTLCHLLAVGAAWRDVPAYLFHTDQREPMKVDKRPYAYIDGRDLKKLTTIMEGLLNNDGFCIIDGAGNRPDFDIWISDAVDLVLIPVVADEEAVCLAMKTMNRLEGQGITHARYVLNMTSTNQHSRQYDIEHFFSKLDSKKIAGEVRHMAAVKRLRISDEAAPFPTPPSNVNNLSRSLYRIVDTALSSMNATRREPEREKEVDIELTMA